MLILQKNSFNKNDLITNAGFVTSMGLIWLVFLFIPLLFPALGIGEISPLVHVLLPSVIILPVLGFTLYFVGRPGKLLRKCKLINLRPAHIYVSFAALAVLSVCLKDFMQIYLHVLALLGVKAEPPVIDQLIKNSSRDTLTWLCFGVIVLAPVSEELVFRRFIFGFLAPRCGFAASLLISSGLFALIHFSLYSFPGLFILGVGFQMIYLKFGSLYPAILMHAFNNAFAIIILLFFPELQV
ncbi:MAG: type II CAAX endopeptidase family protein [Victivallaceae bacterium]|nr:type II CAAX endopeptidase family protein [Victivallaceae bacterium]